MAIRKGTLTLAYVLPYILIVAATIGLIASFTLTYDKVHVLQGTGYQPGCNINPILSCGSVMKTEQASLLGVPNTIFGLMAFSMLLTFGFLLAGGAQVKRWVWLAVQFVATVGVVFMLYLFFQGVYRINAICPWCFVVWIVTIPVFWYITLYNISQRHIVVPAKLRRSVAYIQQHHVDFLILWYMILLGIILHRFWYYWSTLLL